MSEQLIIDEVIGRINDWESDMSQFFGLWNEWASSYRMIDTRKNPRPTGVSKVLTGETPRAVNALATSITRMQTAADPYFELRGDSVKEEQLFDAEKRLQRQLMLTEFKRNLLKGNRGLCLFGTQVWEEPYISYPAGTPTPIFQGTGFTPLSLLQVAFESSVYDMKLSDYIATLSNVNGNYLRFVSNSGNGVWNQALIEQGIKEKQDGGESDSKSRIEERRTKGQYNDISARQNELILWHGRLTNLENPVLLEMWQKFGRTDDIKHSDITVGILNRKYLVRLHPTPYGTWHHMYKIGHYIEFELEPLGYGVGALGNNLQKDMNRIVTYAYDVAKFSLWNLWLSGRGGGMKPQNMNIFPFSVIPVDDINQIKEFRPQIEGIVSGLKLHEITREDFRGVTHATATLQAINTGGTATEASLAQGEAMRAVSLTAEINGDTVNRPHLETMYKNDIDQNPFDSQIVRGLDILYKVVTDKDYRPEHSKQLIQIASFITSIRSQLPLDFNVMPILKYLVRSVGINPREIKEPRPQIDRMLDVLTRVNADSETKQAMLGEEASLSNQSNPPADIPGPVPNSPISSLGVL